MKKIYLLPFLLILHCFTYAQTNYTVSFEEHQKSVSRAAQKEQSFRIKLHCNPKEYKDSAQFTVVLLVDETNSTIAPNFYSVDFTPINFSQISDTNIAAFFTLQKDAIPDRARQVLLKVRVLKNGKKVRDYEDTMLLTINEIKTDDSLQHYQYLAYIGTSFDLVDGVKASHFFFATNIFLPPSKSKTKIGAYLSLYGNRTMTSTDSSGNVRVPYKTSKLSDSSYMEYTEQAKLTRTRVSDNIGAYCSALVPLTGCHKSDAALQVYYAPSLEFVWRRTTITSLYENGRNQDSSIVYAPNGSSVDLDRTNSIHGNEYNFNLGLIGFMVAHESPQISVRVHASVGNYAVYTAKNLSNLSQDQDANYSYAHDFYFCGRAWITEASSGITLQAEITNTLNVKRPYYGLTLSKAINFKHLGSIFQPVSSR